MADPFPAIEPTSRSYRLPLFPLSSQGARADPLIFRHGLRASGQLLTLVFQGLSAADARLIRSHYRQALQPFTLDPIIGLGHGSVHLAPAAQLWVYAKPPEEIHRSGDQIDITAELVSTRGQLAPGAGMAITLSVQPGAASTT